MDLQGLLPNLGLALLAAVVGGFAARALGLPLLIGYLLAGIVVGPHTPGMTADSKAVHEVATLGVALLMFAVGVQFHLDEMLSVWRLALLGGSVQIVGTIALGWLVGLAAGWGHFAGVFLGCALALSSTAVMMRILEDRGELGAAHGTTMLGILVVQDLAVVVMVAVLPALSHLGEAGSAAWRDVAISVLRAAVLLTLALILARRWVPALLERAARQNSQELFLILIVSVCIGAAYLAQLGGFSLEIGAFLAGLVISESDYAHEVFSQIRPVRDIFASLFFVSVGMLLDPVLLLRDAPSVIIIVIAIVAGKGALTTVTLLCLGAHGRTALFTGLGLAQIGEFSFVLATIGTERGLISTELSGVILCAALVTILLSPLVYGAANPLYDRLNRIGPVSEVLNRERPKCDMVIPEAVRPRVLLLGCGRVGMHVSEALRTRQIPHLVVEYDATVVTRLRQQGVPVLYGDATSPAVLSRALAERLDLAIIALPETSLTPLAVKELRKMCPDLSIVVRVHRNIHISKVRAAGADEIVHAEFEAATELIRQGLARLGESGEETEEYLREIRRLQYLQP